MAVSGSGPKAPLPELGRYVLFSHGWTWGFWSLIFLTPGGVWEVPGVIFLVLGGLGVPVGGILMARRAGGPEGLADLGRSLWDPRRASPAVWAVVLLIFPAATLAGGVVDVLHAGGGFDALVAGSGDVGLDLRALRARLARPGTLLAFAGFVLLVGPLPEEIGWRGFAQDRLQRSWSPLIAALVVGVLWAVWHVPLYLLEGYYAAFGTAGPEPAEHLAGVLVASVIYAWIYNRSGRSLLAVVVLHFMQNFTGELLGPSVRADTWTFVVLVLVAIAVVAVEGTGLGRAGGVEPKPAGFDDEAPAPKVGG